jgi:hypothetical protein
LAANDTKGRESRHTETEQLPEPIPPTALRVAQRALVLSAVICRSGIEGDGGNQQAEALREQVVGWIERLGLNGEAEPEEMELLRTPLGSLPKKRLVEASWRTEGLVVLAWALGRCELPDYDREANGPDTADTIGFLEEKDNAIIHQPALRPRLEIAALADHLFTLHWRLRQFSLDQASMDFQEFSRTAWFGPAFARSPSTDRKRPRDSGPASLPSNRRTMAGSTEHSQERHQAVNWLEGQDPIYSEVTADP